MYDYINVANAISIHAPREGGDANTDKRERLVTDISIHAPREGGDDIRSGPSKQGRSISIHAPREGGDSAVVATLTNSPDFNPRPPRGGRHDLYSFFPMA